jgi:hypothetical protein
MLANWLNISLISCGYSQRVPTYLINDIREARTPEVQAVRPFGALKTMLLWTTTLVRAIR